MAATPVYFECEVGHGAVDPAERSRLAAARHAEHVRALAAELASVDGDEPAPDDWTWTGALLVRCRRPSWSSRRAELVDLILEGAAQANVRDVDLVGFVDLPALALDAVTEASAHAEERLAE
jgi:hypothetical protein